jgi:hypothetical protein
MLALCVFLKKRLARERPILIFFLDFILERLYIWFQLRSKDRKSDVREKSIDEERDQEGSQEGRPEEGSQEGRQKSTREEKEVVFAKIN